MELITSRAGVEDRPCLNPYYNGRYSWRRMVLLFIGQRVVLILIIMEDTHGVTMRILMMIYDLVLILIIMEDTHGAPWTI